MPAKRKSQVPSWPGRSCGAFLLLTLLSIRPAATLEAPRQIPDSLVHLKRSYPGPVEDAIEALKRGANLLSEKRYRAALEALSAAQPVSGFLVEDYTLQLRASAWLGTGQPEEAIRCFHTLRERWPDSRLRRESILGECETLVESGKPKAALALLEESGPPPDAGSLLQRALAEEASGNRKAATGYYLRVYSDFVNASEAQRAGDRLAALAPAFMSRPENVGPLLQRAENLLRAGRSTDARILLLRLEQVKIADAALRARRSVLLADAEHRQGRDRRALDVLHGVTAADPESHAQALCLQAACNRALKREQAFLRARDLAVQLYPQSRWTEIALYSVATFYEVENRIEPLQEAYASLLTSFPRGEYAERSSWRTAILAYAAGRHEEALRRFVLHLRSYSGPDSAAATAFWLGRCLERLNDPRGASLFYRRAAAIASGNYYGQLAQQAANAISSGDRGIRQAVNGADLQMALRVLEAIKVQPVAITEPAGSAAMAIERALQLSSADLHEEALAELRVAAGRHPEEKSIPFVAALIHEKRGDLKSVITVLRRAFPDYQLLPPPNLPDEFREMLFPVRYYDLIRVHSASHKLDPSLVLGLIRQESAFETTSRSRANARGLMQILPSTGRYLAREEGLRGYSISRLYQAEPNIALGTRYLAGLLQTFGGKTELALASYNAGEQRVQRWKTQFGDTDLPLFVEQVPFAETRQYIKQVLTNREHYRSIIDAGGEAGR